MNTKENADSAQLAEHVKENRNYWDGMAIDWVASGERHWKLAEPTWGIWALKEADLQLLPEDMTGLNAVELGCGTGYVSSWMARRGASVTGIDNSLEQLKTAQRLNDEHGLNLTLMHGNAEATPYEDASFDFAISEYGAAIWCDPYAWVPEAHRILKTGGLLTFLGTHPLVIVTTPPNGEASDERLHRSYFDIHKQDWRDLEVDPGGIEFNLTQSAWLKLFRDTGFEVLNYQELQAPLTANDTKFSITGEWAQKWPSEQVWQLRKKA